MASPISLPLLALIAASATACTNRATPPESTPVYADNIAPGIAPISVERLSVNRPEVDKIDEPASGKTGETAGDEASQGVTPVEQEPKETDGENQKNSAPAENKETAQE